MSNKARCVVLVKQMFRSWMKRLLHFVGLVKLKEPMHPTQTQSVRVKEKNIFYLLVTIVATLQEVRINVYFILISKSSPYVLSYKSIYSKVNTVGYFSNVLIETLFTNKLKTVFCKTVHPKTKSPR